METIFVNISEMFVSRSRKHILVTHSLGSCLGLAAFDPIAGVGGLIHCLLPSAVNYRQKAEANPAMFVSIGVPTMIKRMYAKGATRENLVLKAAGCARMLNVQNQFDTGAKNHAELMRLCEKNDIRLAAEDTGGAIPRTMYLHMDSGQVVISSCGKRWDL